MVWPHVALCAESQHEVSIDGAINRFCRIFRSIEITRRSISLQHEYGLFAQIIHMAQIQHRPGIDLPGINR